MLFCGSESVLVDSEHRGAKKNLMWFMIVVINEISRDNGVRSCRGVSLARDE